MPKLIRSDFILTCSPLIAGRLKLILKKKRAKIVKIVELPEINEIRITCNVSDIVFSNIMKQATQTFYFTGYKEQTTEICYPGITKKIYTFVHKI